MTLQECLREANVRSRARSAMLRADSFFGCQHRKVEVRVRPKTLDSRRCTRGSPEGYPSPSEYVRWLSEEGYIEPFAYLRDEWVWRPVIRRVLAGPVRAERRGNILLFERPIAEQLDDLEQDVVETVRRTGSTFNVEVVVPHVFGLRLTCERIRWRAYDHRRRSLQTVYLDVPDRRQAAASSHRASGPILCPNVWVPSVHAPPSRPHGREPQTWEQSAETLWRGNRGLKKN